MQRQELFNIIKLGDINLLLKIIENGFPLNEVMKEKYGYLTDHIVLSRPYPEITKLLIKWELKTNKWFSDCILEDAIYNADSELASIAIELGANVNGGEFYRNQIVDIVNYDNIKMCKLFVEKGVNLDITDEYDRGVFHYVKSHEMMDIILPFMVRDHKDTWGKTAYETHMECIPNGNGNDLIDCKLRIELGNRIAQQLCI
jgi:hypothetical protein